MCTTLATPHTKRSQKQSKHAPLLIINDISSCSFYPSTKWHTVPSVCCAQAMCMALGHSHQCGMATKGCKCQTHQILPQGGGGGHTWAKAWATSGAPNGPQVLHASPNWPVGAMDTLGLGPRCPHQPVVGLAKTQVDPITNSSHVRNNYLVETPGMQFKHSRNSFG